MCFGAGSSNATINASNPAAAKDLSKSTTAWTDPKLTAPPGSTNDPLVAPDLTDKAIQEARKRQLLMPGQGRRSTFLTGPMGVEGAAPTVRRKTALTGY